MRGKCKECMQPKHFQRNCPVRRQRLLRPDEDADALPDLAGSADGAGSLGNGQSVLDVVSGSSAGSSDGAGSSVAGHLILPVGTSTVPPVVIPDGAGSPAARQSILARVRMVPART